MLRVAVAAGAHTIIGENVPNLLSIHKGQDFAKLLGTLADAGFKYVGWRILNARAFGLPQERRRLFLVASRTLELACSLHAQVPAKKLQITRRPAFGFYWTAGSRSLCFSSGFVPTLKIGASDEKGRAPVAVLTNGRVRKLNKSEYLRLQGFEADQILTGQSATDVLRMAGNAVSLPVGQFVMKSVLGGAASAGQRSGFGKITEAGLYDDGIIWEIEHEAAPLASNLGDFLDQEGEQLTAQASAGLLVRSIRAGQPMPLELFDALFRLTRDRSQKLHPSRANSFEALTTLGDSLEKYRSLLEPISPQLLEAV
jgi:DNA (cytosine-5)-methyltransferase 1